MIIEDHEASRRRHSIVKLAAFAAANFTLGSLVQTGAIRRLPDPPIPGVDSYRVMTSRAAYPFGVPDAPVALAFHATVMALAGLAIRVRPRRQRLIDRLIASGVLAGAVGVARYAIEMVRLRRACVYCIAAGATMLAMVPPALHNARVGRV